MAKKIDNITENDTTIVQINKTFSDLGYVFEKNQKIHLTNNKKMIEYFQQKEIQGFVSFIKN
jgi:hypothetical protein